MLTREEILSKTDLKKEVVNVPEWGGDVFVSEMSGATRDRWEQGLQERNSKGKLIASRAKLVVATVVDENGNPMFEEKDIEELGKLSAVSLENICDVALRINKLMTDDLENAKKN